ncbi:hypothetical protein ZIOFF_010166 [Zingiber officinale]|uniref:Uncharacterized protein n=1 Tax=Zingiber officinale TaxID=94328 RepID=A0A8J5HLT4_ZINOF|nr:hypothetical protein ZIOFF_010166 [Zingiber officinale]
MGFVLNSTLALALGLPLNPQEAKEAEEVLSALLSCIDILVEYGSRHVVPSGHTARPPSTASSRRIVAASRPLSRVSRTVRIGANASDTRLSATTATPTAFEKGNSEEDEAGLQHLLRVFTGVVAPEDSLISDLTKSEIPCQRGSESRETQRRTELALNIFSGEALLKSNTEAVVDFHERGCECWHDPSNFNLQFWQQASFHLSAIQLHNQPLCIIVRDQFSHLYCCPPALLVPSPGPLVTKEACTSCNFGNLKANSSLRDAARTFNFGQVLSREEASASLRRQYTTVVIPSGTSKTFSQSSPPYLLIAYVRISSDFSILASRSLDSRQIKKTKNKKKARSYLFHVDPRKWFHRDDDNILKDVILDELMVGNIARRCHCFRGVGARGYFLGRKMHRDMVALVYCHRLAPIHRWKDWEKDTTSAEYAFTTEPVYRDAKGKAISKEELLKPKEEEKPKILIASIEFTNLKYSRVEIDEVRFEWTECMLDYI